jgi:hypothetical protein
MVGESGMRTYCKAYLVREFRQFSGWNEQQDEDSQRLSDEDICYLWDDCTVVKSPVEPGGVVFDTITPEWESFCRTVLQFEIPDDVRDIDAQADAAALGN